LTASGIDIAAKASADCGSYVVLLQGGGEGFGVAMWGGGEIFSCRVYRD
jgi:hypothetical protein